MKATVNLHTADPGMNRDNMLNEIFPLSAKADSSAPELAERE